MIYELSTDAVMTAVLVLSSVMVFGPYALTALGWTIYGLAFAGSSLHVTCRVFDLGSNLYNKVKTKLNEREGLKPRTSAA